MPRFDDGRALNKESELEKQQREMLAKKREYIGKETPDINEYKINDNEKIELATSNVTRITLRLPDNVYNTLKLIAKFDDKSINGLITEACIAYLARPDKQEKIKKYNKLKNQL